jgi:sugar O-acyltransferase (sialic acid O-acetyltransferase NeuD family)
MKRFGIFGTSGMAREAGDIAYDLGYSALYVARDKAELDAWNCSDEVVLEVNLHRYKDLQYVIGIGENAVRRRVVQRFVNEIKFSNLIHTSATFGQGSRALLEKKQGVIVAAGVRFTNNVQVGNFDIFNQGALIAHDVELGDFVHIAPGGIISGNVSIGHGCWIGAGAIINQGTNQETLHIGENTVIGSGAVVIRSCESDAVYVGVPAKRIK